ncbi:hypothetical protein TKK_0010723 [Trichogramma kaykai]|uniref:Protein sleepless n=1 Tax=Trichogramma kaykai TaxID=54128 RepID=A0ABD2WXC9_9HYME
MYPKKCTATATYSLALIAVLFVNSVNGLRCYTCSSVNTGECYTNPAQDKFITDCNPSSLRSASNAYVNSTSARAIFSDSSMRALDSVDERWECAKIVATSMGVTTVLRTCVTSQVPCHDVPNLVSCDRCNKELCNSAESASLATGLFAVLGALGVYRATM